MEWTMSPFIIPLGAFAVAIVAIIAGAVGEANRQRLKAEQRMAMVARGMTAEDIDKLLGKVSSESKEPLRNKLGRARTTSLALISTGVGISVFGILLTWIVREHEVLVVAAAGLIPLAIGVGFLVDYILQRRELARFGLEAGRPE